MDIAQYNYDEFTPNKVIPILNFMNSPMLGMVGEDFPLWRLDGSETRLNDIWSQNLYTIVEFGSFT